MRIFLLILWLLLVLIHVPLFYFGIGSIVGTITLITLGILPFYSLLYFITKWRPISEKHSSNCRLFIISMSILWLAVELFLKYGWQQHQSYGEKNGGFLYISPYLVKETAWSNLWQENLHIYKPNLKKNYAFEEYSYDLTTNSEGLRNKEVSINKPSNEFRILALGDSFTEGRGVTHKETWPVLLESALNQTEGRNKFNVINGGISGSDPVFELQLLKSMLLKFDLNVVIVSINQSDVTDLIVRGGLDRYDKEGMVHYNPGPWWEGFYANSFMVRLLVHNFSELDFLFNTKKSQGEKRKVAEIELFETFKAFYNLAEKEEFQLIIAFHPLREEFILEKMELASLIKKTKNETSAIVVNLLNHFVMKKNADMTAKDLYWPTDLHHNAEGYKVYSKGIQDIIVNSGLLNQ